MEELMVKAGEVIKGGGRGEAGGGGVDFSDCSGGEVERMEVVANSHFPATALGNQIFNKN